MMPEPTDTPEIASPTVRDLIEIRPMASVRPERARYIDPDPPALVLELAAVPTARPETDERRRALAITRTYRERQPLSNSKVVAQIIGAAIKADRWTDREITAAALRLAGEDRRLTHETLRVELTYRLIERARQRRRGELDTASVVYVIGCDESPLVKIGTSTDLMQRLHDIQRMCPVMLRVLHEHPGGYELENALHRRYRSYRKHGEWFDLGRLDPVDSVKRAIGLIEGRPAKAAARPANPTDHCVYFGEIA